MLYVLRYTVAAGSGRREGFKVCSARSDAIKLYLAVESKMQPKGPIASCMLYETDASETEAALLAAKMGSARQLDTSGYPKSAPVERSLDDMITEMIASNGPRAM